MAKIMTPEQVKEKLRAEGMTITSWAIERGYEVPYVYAVLNGRTKARFGKAHEIAVALGMKANPEKLSA